jgi:hypothetical protein
MSTPEQIHNLKPTPTDARHGGQDPSFQSEPASTHLRVIALEGGVVFVGPLSRARPFELPGDLEAALAHASSVVMAGDDCYVTPGLVFVPSKLASGAPPEPSREPAHLPNRAGSRRTSLFRWRGAALLSDDDLAAIRSACALRNDSSS